jgi:hypothetical protein
VGNLLNPGREQLLTDYVNRQKDRWIIQEETAKTAEQKDEAKENQKIYDTLLKHLDETLELNRQKRKTKEEKEQAEDDVLEEATKIVIEADSESEKVLDEADKIVDKALWKRIIKRRQEKTNQKSKGTQQTPN